MLRRYEPALLLAWSMVTAGLVFGDIHHPVRTAFSLIFFAIIPGLAITRLMGIANWEMTILLAVPVSLSLDAAISAILVYSGFPSWNLGLSILLSITVGAVILDLARPTFGAQAIARPAGGKLDDEARQATVMRVLLKGGSLIDAAEAAGVSPTTLQRALRRSQAMRRAVSVASHGAFGADLDAPMPEPPLGPGGLGPAGR